MSSTFQLLTEPWIPLIGADGRRQEASLMDTLLTPERWRRIDGASPIETLSLYRLLLAICHRAIGPDPDPRVELLDHWPREKLETYLQEWANHFDLLHPATPFLQVACLKAAGLKPSPWTRLALERSTGAARLIWDHSIDAKPSARSFAQIARMLVAHLQFTPGGLVKALRTSAIRGPATGLLLMLPTGDSLQETLALSLVPQTRDQYEADRPAWERPPLELDQLQKPQEIPLEGAAHRYTLLSRAILLQPESESIRWLLYAEGIVASDANNPTVDPMAAVVDGKKGPMPLLISEQKTFWRDFQAMTRTEGGREAATIRHATELRMERGDERPIYLQAGGLLPDQAKIILWRLEEQRIPPVVLHELKLSNATGKALKLAEDAGSALEKALYILCVEWLKDGSPQEPDPKAARALRESIAAGPLYWSRLEGAFWTFVALLGSRSDPEAALSMWRAELQEAVLASWHQATATLGLDSRALAAAGRSSRPLGKALAGLSP